MKSSPYTPEDVVLLPYFQRDLEELDKQIKNLSIKRSILHIKVRDVKFITEFYQGQPICVSDNSALHITRDIESVPDNGRGALVYHNCSVHHTVDKWCVRLSATELDNPRWKPFQYGGLVLGYDYTFEQAMVLGKDWVVLATYPEEE